MSYFSVDIEADGQIPGLYSMVLLGAVKIEQGLEHTFYGELYPISDRYDPKALSISTLTREQTLLFENPIDVMTRFSDWVHEHNKHYRPIFISDNNGFDWSFVNYYFHAFLGQNPFGWSSRNICDLHHGLCKSMFSRPKKLRKTKHNHDPVNDAKGNAEIVLAMKYHMGLEINLK